MLDEPKSEVKAPLDAGVFTLEGVRQSRNGTDVLGPVDLALPASSISVLLGPSGAGKTTCLRLLNRLDEPASGVVFYRGRSLPSIPVRELRRNVGMVFQTPVLFAGTVGSNLDEAAELAELPDDERMERAAGALEAAELGVAFLGRGVDDLSSGERQRATLARALIGSPDVLLLDEPTGALDVETAQRLLATLRRLALNGLTVVMATHRLEEARAVAEWVVLLDRGRIVEAAEATRFFRSPATERAQAFLAGGGGL